MAVAGTEGGFEQVFKGRVEQWRSLDYVSGWFMKAADYMGTTRAASAFVTTNSLNQGQQAAILWPAIFATGQEIAFAHTSFKWANLASHNAGVTVAVVGMSNDAGPVRRLYSIGEAGETIQREAGSINAYLAAAANVIVRTASKPLNGLAEMSLREQACRWRAPPPSPMTRWRSSASLRSRRPDSSGAFTVRPSSFAGSHATASGSRTNIWKRRLRFRRSEARRGRARDAAREQGQGCQPDG